MSIKLQYRHFAASSTPCFDRNKATLKLEPGLAVSWRNVNPTTWEFMLRPGVAFHDGEPFDAAAVQFSLIGLSTERRYSWPRSGAPVREVQVVVPLTVQIVTKQPDPLSARTHGGDRW